MKSRKNIWRNNRKGLIMVLVFIVCMILLFTTINATNVNEHLAWHFLQQIALGGPDGNMTSVDQDNNGKIDWADNSDYAYNADTLDGYNSSYFLEHGGGGMGSATYVSEWINIDARQEKHIVHNLGSSEFSNFQIILRESEVNDDEVIMQGMGNGMNIVATGPKDGGWSSYGIECYIDKNDNPSNKIKCFSGDNGVWWGMDPDQALSNRNWGEKLYSGQIKIKIWI